MSFALLVNDINFNFLHSTMWDIKLSRTSLDEGIPNVYEPFGAGDMRQAWSFRGSVIGYAGPCPSPGPNTYEFTIHAIPVVSLPGLSANTDREVARDAVEAASIGAAVVSGNYTRAD